MIAAIFWIKRGYDLWNHEIKNNNIKRKFTIVIINLYGNNQSFDKKTNILQNV